MVALAIAAMPSSRPVKPSRSLVVAFTATRDRFEAGDLGDARAHGVAVRADLRPLADQRHIEMRDASAARGDAIDRVFQELIARRRPSIADRWAENASRYRRRPARRGSHRPARAGRHRHRNAPESLVLCGTRTPQIIT